MKKLIEAVDQFAGQAVGQKPGDQVRGTERATKKKSGKHPFAGRLVGASEGTNLLVDLEKQIVEGSQERNLKEEFAQYELNELNLFRKKPKPEPIEDPEDYRKLFNKEPLSFNAPHPLDVKHYHNSRDYYEKTGINPLDVKQPIKELAVDDGGSGGEDDVLHKFARMWWAGDEATQIQIEAALARMGWEIGEDEGSYDNGGVFVVRAGDVNGNSYISWSAEDLTEGIMDFMQPQEPKTPKDKLTIAAMRQIEKARADKERQDPSYVRSNDLPSDPTHRRTVTDEEKAGKVELPPPENARKTQIAGTLPTYKKAAEILKKSKVKGKALDFGAGLGHGTKELGKGAHSYEPFPGETFKPHFVEVGSIPDNAYHKIVNLNVLNVVPNAGKQRIRDSIVTHIGRVLAPGGVAIITTRGKDVLTIKGTPGEEPMSMISKIGTYQKGFTPSELQEYVQGLLGDEFVVSKIKLGPAGIMIKKHKQGVAEGNFKQTPGQRQYGALHSQLKSLANSGQINTPNGKQKAEKMIDTIQQLVDTDPSCAGSTVPSKKIWLSEQGVAEGEADEFAPSTRAADQIAASGWRRGGEMTGSSLKGYIETKYADLVSVFGAPYYGPDDEGDKITCEWVITFRDGKVATIYDWKVGEVTPTDLYDWHVGGTSPKVLDYVATLMMGKGTPRTSLWEEHLLEEHQSRSFARNVYFNVTADKSELAQAVSKSIGFHPTSKDGIWKYSVMKNENPENTRRKVEQLEKYFGPHIIARKNNIGESIGASVDLTKNYSNYNSVKGTVVEISPKGRLRIKITTADIDPGRRAAIRVGDTINVASNYVKKGIGESGETVYEAIKPEQLSQLSQLKRDLQQKSVQPPAPVDQDEIDAWERDFKSAHGTRTFAQDNAVTEPEAPKADWRTLPRQGRNKVKTQLQKSNELIGIGEKIVKLLDRAERFPGGLPPGIRSDVENVESAFDGNNIDYDRMLEMYTKLVTELVDFVNMKRAVYRKPKTPRYESEAAVQTDTHSPSPVGSMEEDQRKSHLSKLMDQIDQLGHKEVTEEVPPPVATAGGPAGSPPNVQQPNAPVDPAQAALLKQQQAKMQQNLANLKTAGVNIDPAKAAQSLQKTDTGTPLNAMDKDTIAAMAPAIGNVMSNPSTATQLNTLIKKAGGGA